MSLPVYPIYQDSSIEWIGKLPAHWTVARLKAAAHLVMGQSPSSESYNQIGIGIPFLQGNADFGEICPQPRHYCDCATKYADEGDVLFSVRAPVGAINAADQRYGIGRGLCAIRGRASVDSSFLRYALEVMREDLLSVATGSTYVAVSVDQVASTPIALPSKSEQKTIASFLDRETAKSDTLIAEQKKLLTLLAEKRQATISHAVTRGLSPNVPMKDSGVPWLGEVPAHWGVTPLKWMVDPNRPIMYGIVLPGPDVGEGIPILKGGNVKPSRMNLESMARTTPAIEAPYARARLRAGDLVYSIRGTIGDCESVPDAMEGANITQDVARIAVASSEVAAWVRWVLLSSPVREELAVGSLGAAVRGINTCDLKRVKIPQPPASEQAEIATALDEKVSAFDQLSRQAESAIGLLQERRSALISAAVTGKIDVREVASAELT